MAVHAVAAAVSAYGTSKMMNGQPGSTAGLHVAAQHRAAWGEANRRRDQRPGLGHTASSRWQSRLAGFK